LSQLSSEIRLLGDVLGQTLRAQEGDAAFTHIEQLRRAAIALRAGELPGGRDGFAVDLASLELPALERVARCFTLLFHLINVAEEQERIRALRRMDRAEAPTEGSIAHAVAGLAREGARPDEVRALVGRLFVMPVLTAHPTEARRRTVLDHLAAVSDALGRLDDERAGARERAATEAELRRAVLALHASDEARPERPTPLDEVRAASHVFSRTLFDVTPAIHRELEDALAETWPGERLSVGPFLRWGSWVGGDRDGNPHVTAEVTRAAFELHRAIALGRHLADVDGLHRELSASSRRVSLPAELAESLAEERARSPELAARAARHRGEPIREKLAFIAAHLAATRDRKEGAYPDAAAYTDELRLLERSLAAAGLQPLARGSLYDARRRAEVFGFHLASLDVRQHSAVHEAAVAELLARGGLHDYAGLDERARTTLLVGLLERPETLAPRDRAGLSSGTRELLATLDVVARARRDLGPEACERWVVSFTSQPSDLLEVLFLARAARLAPDELRPIPLLEQRADLDGAEALADRMLALRPIRVACRGELEVMIGYSDSGKQAGYVSSSVALHRAQAALERVADDQGVTLTIFHGRGGAIGRGGGPAHRAIRAQPPGALRGRLRVTEQGETITARYGRAEIARRDLEQMVSAVLLASHAERTPATAEVALARATVLDRADRASGQAYATLVGDGERLAAYTLAATPIEAVAQLPIGSRPASRAPALSIDQLRAIPWVFSWAQSRHGLPGWFGLGAALEALEAEEGLASLRRHYAEWPFFRALVDNAQVALIRADLDVAAAYAQLAGPDGGALFAEIAAEHARTVSRVLAVTGAPALLSAQPALLATVQRRNPYVDVLNHTQIELLRRLRATAGAEQARVREALFVTINGIAAGLQTSG
jgi:phosphoenolpyruvate carboxylase